MADLIYPAFPKRAFLVGGLVVLVLIAAAVVVNRHGPSPTGCTAAAKREVARNGRVSARWLKTCDGLSTVQVTAALRAAYRAEYGRYLRGTPMWEDLPPASYRAASARSALKTGSASQTGGHG